MGEESASYLPLLASHEEVWEGQRLLVVRADEAVTPTKRAVEGCWWSSSNAPTQA